MKNLHVGCRVRILWSPNYPELAGKEGRIVADSETDDFYAPGDGCFIVAPDAWGTAACPYEDFYFSPHADQIEPIQDPGHQVISWEEMADLWTPEKVGA